MGTACVCPPFRGGAAIAVTFGPASQPASQPPRALFLAKSCGQRVRECECGLLCMLWGAVLCCAVPGCVGCCPAYPALICWCLPSQLCVPHVCASGPAAAGCVCRWLAGVPRVDWLGSLHHRLSHLPISSHACHTSACVCTQLRSSSRGAVVSAGFLSLDSRGVGVCPAHPPRPACWCHPTGTLFMTLNDHLSPGFLTLYHCCRYQFPWCCMCSMLLLLLCTQRTAVSYRQAHLVCWQALSPAVVCSPPHTFHRPWWGSC